MGAMNLKSLRGFTVLCYGTNVIHDLEFILRYDDRQSGEIYPYQKYNQFNLEIFDEASVLLNFVLQKEIFHGRLKHFNCVIK